MVDWNQKITSLGLTWGQGAGTSGDTGLGHGVGFGDRWLGLGHGVGLGDKHGGSEPENQTFRASLGGTGLGHGFGYLISGRKADRLECVPACIYQCHYVRASVLQRVGTYECVHWCVYVSVSICSYSAMYLLCVCACHFLAFQAIHFPVLEAIHFPGLPSEPPTDSEETEH